MNWVVWGKLRRARPKLPSLSARSTLRTILPSVVDDLGGILVLAIEPHRHAVRPCHGYRQTRWRNELPSLIHVHPPHGRPVGPRPGDSELTQVDGERRRLARLPDVERATDPVGHVAVERGGTEALALRPQHDEQGVDLAYDHVLIRGCLDTTPRRVDDLVGRSRLVHPPPLVVRLVVLHSPRHVHTVDGQLPLTEPRVAVARVALPEPDLDAGARRRLQRHRACRPVGAQHVVFDAHPVQRRLHADLGAPVEGKPRRLVDVRLQGSQPADLAGIHGHDGREQETHEQELQSVSLHVVLVALRLCACLVWGS